MNDWAIRFLDKGQVPTYINFLGDLKAYSVGFVQETLSDGEICYLGWHPELDGCMTQVSSLSELPAMLFDARELWIEHGREYGLSIPTPGSHLTVTR